MAESPEELLERIGRELQAAMGSARPGLAFQVTSVEPIAAGHSGFSYWVATADSPTRFVLRLPPPGVRPKGSADVARQGQIMMAVAEHQVPVPRVIAISERPAVDGRPFMVTEEVCGDPGPIASRGSNPTSLAVAAVRALLRVHALRPDQSGIGQERIAMPRDEVARWVAVARRGATDLLGVTSDVEQMLEEQAPPATHPGLVHGDYHIGNLLFRRERVTGIVDWEIAHLGAPLLDLATFCTSIFATRYPAMRALGTVLDVRVPDVVELYGVASRDVAWYLALASFKCAAILSYNLELHRKGIRQDPFYDSDDVRATIREGVVAARGMLLSPMDSLSMFAP